VCIVNPHAVEPFETAGWYLSLAANRNQRPAFGHRRYRWRNCHHDEDRRVSE